MIRITLLFIVCLLSSALRAQSKINPSEIRQKMQWFEDAKLGIFIHTGIYSVNGIDESWSFYNNKISYADYMKQLNGFTMKNYDPSFWADLIKGSGARYAVITTKHHDGVSLYDTKQNQLSSVEATPAKRDIVSPLFNELRKRDIKCGAYFSLIDWTHPDYPGFLKDSAKYNVEKDYERWNRFRQFFQRQIVEINSSFKPDLWWFDGDWEQSAERWESEKVRQLILSENPRSIINGRLQGYGDYATPEQNFPVTKPHYEWWELCMTTNNNWGYQPKDVNWKTAYEIITIFVDVVANGGNLLLDIGPKADGSIPVEQINLLKELGSWNNKNGEAIFGKRAGIPHGHFYGPTTLSRDSTELYLFVQGKSSGPLMLKGLKNKIEHISVVGSSSRPSHKIVGKISWSHVPGLVYIELPKKDLDEYVTVVKIKLDKPISLYRGVGGFN
ncbi:MAG: alpha-L-fucosidase [Cyclobacteriaceae bacterium]|nr:alpha-L-fucosidase [Cyclobacteriaceae bacterium]